MPSPALTTGVRVGKARLLASSGRAIKVLFEDDDVGEQWLPNSQVHDDSELYDGCAVGEEGEVVVTPWFAEQRGWS